MFYAFCLICLESPPWTASVGCQTTGLCFSEPHSETVTEPRMTEPRKTEPRKTEPRKTERRKTEPQMTEPGMTEPRIGPNLE
jgi:hypothetical protein